MGKQSQLLLKPTEVELGLQVGVEFDNNTGYDLHKMRQNLKDEKILRDFPR